MRAVTVRDTTPEVEAPAGPSHEEIAARAYDLYMEREAGEGNELEDWLRAERELVDVHVQEPTFTSTRRRFVRSVTEHDLASK